MGTRPDVPCARRTIFVAHREAAEARWGAAGLAALAERLPADARAATIDPLVIADEWLPERFLIAWHEAMWVTTCNRDVAELYRFVQAMMDRGFGRVQRFMLHLITPATLFARGASLWRHDHTHGELTCELTGDRSGVLRLRDHPYVDSAFLRRSVAETYRYAGALTRCRAVRAAHAVEGGVLVVKVDWE